MFTSAKESENVQMFLSSL